MSFGGGRGARKPLPPGSEFNWQKAPGELPDGAPTPTFPVLSPRPVMPPLFSPLYHQCLESLQSNNAQPALRHPHSRAVTTTRTI